MMHARQHTGTSLHGAPWSQMRMVWSYALDTICPLRLHSKFFTQLPAVASRRVESAADAPDVAVQLPDVPRGHPQVPVADGAVVAACARSDIDTATMIVHR